MLFLQFILYSSSFVSAIEKRFPHQLQIKHFSPGILKFSTKHKDNPFTLNYPMVSRTFLFIFHTGSRRLGFNSFRNSGHKEKTAC